MANPNKPKKQYKPKPKVIRRKKKDREEVVMSGTEKEPLVQEEATTQAETKKGEDMRNGDLTALAKKINEAIIIKDRGLDVDSSQRAELGGAIFSIVFEGNFGVLEQHRMVAPYYMKKHPEFQQYKENWTALIDKIKETRKDMDSTRESTAIQRRLREFYRSQAILFLAKEQGERKDIHPNLLVEIQRERWSLDVMKETISEVVKGDLTESQTSIKRKEIAKRLKREKRLKRADKIHKRADSLIDSLNFALDDEPVSFRDLRKLATDERAELLTKLTKLETRLKEASSYVGDVLQYLEMNGSNGNKRRKTETEAEESFTAILNRFIAQDKEREKRTTTPPTTSAT